MADIQRFFSFPWSIDDLRTSHPCQCQFLCTYSAVCRVLSCFPSLIFGFRMQTPHGALFPFGPSSVILPVSLSDVRQNAFNFTSSSSSLLPHFLSLFFFTSARPLRGFSLSVSIPFWIVSRDPFSHFAPFPPIPQSRRLFAYPPPCPPTTSKSPSPSSTSSLLVLSRVCLRYA